MPLAEHPPQVDERRFHVAPVDGVGEVPGSRCAGVTENGLEVVLGDGSAFTVVGFEDVEHRRESADVLAEVIGEAVERGAVKAEAGGAGSLGDPRRTITRTGRRAAFDEGRSGLLRRGHERLRLASEDEHEDIDRIRLAYVGGKPLHVVGRP